MGHKLLFDVQVGQPCFLSCNDKISWVPFIFPFRTLFHYVLDRLCVIFAVAFWTVYVSPLMHKFSTASQFDLILLSLVYIFHGRCIPSRGLCTLLITWSLSPGIFLVYYSCQRSRICFVDSAITQGLLMKGLRGISPEF